jgi:hypothetical protein
LLSHWLRR